MKRILGWAAAAVAMIGLAAIGPVQAQMSSNPAEITACLCEQQGIATLSGEMSAKTNALAAARQRVADLDARLQQERQQLNPNDAEAVARFKSLLAERDQAYQASLGGVVTTADQATARYNAHVNQYNAQCANRIFNADLMAQLQAHLVCPPLE